MLERQTQELYQQPKGSGIFLGEVPEPGSPSALTLARQEARHRKLSIIKKIGLRVGASMTGAALVAGGGAALMSREQSAPASQDRQVQINPEVEEAERLEALVDTSTRDMAGKIITMIEQTGGNGYRGDMFGNKNDHKWGAPEGFLAFDESKGKLYATVVNMYDKKTGQPVGKYDSSSEKSEDSTEFTSLGLTFSVDQDSSLNGITKQLQGQDFEAAIKEGSVNLSLKTSPS